MYELTLQLFIIMIAKQTWNNILELLIPWVSATYKLVRASKCLGLIRLLCCPNANDHICLPWHWDTFYEPL